MNNWWIEVKFSNGYYTPFTPCKHPIQSDTVPEGNFFGPYCCPDCALTCVSFGKTERQAWEFNHGNDDQKFATFLGYA